MMRPSSRRIPGDNWVERILYVLAAYEALEWLVYGAAFLVFAFAIWRMAVPHERGPAMQKAAQDGREIGLWIFGGVGAIMLIGGGLLLAWLVRDYRRANDGRWG